MIKKQDILERAAEWRLRADVVEKDYVLGWLLAGIAHHPELRNTWIFKGGTCLKKCFFETYRFSEDLDFSLLPSALYDREGLIRQLLALARWVQELSGIELPEGGITIDTKQNKQGELTFRARVSYRGPLAVPTPPRVLFDLTRQEPVVAVPVRRPVFHPYPDALPRDSMVSAYALEELLAEKTRALHERTRPRDLYDVVHLVETCAGTVDFTRARDLFRKKCSVKGISTPSSATLLVQMRASGELEADWDTMLAHQLPTLPPFAAFPLRAMSALAWIDEPVSSPGPRPPRITAPSQHRIFAPAGINYWGKAGPLELVRFAGANRLLVLFSYKGKDRTVEPYSLRQADTGNLLLYGWDAADGHIKAFKVTEISGLTVSERTFVPRYAMELTAISSTPRRS